MALLNVVLPHTDPLHRFPLFRRGPALGRDDVSAGKKNKHSAWKREELDELVVLMGGPRRRSFSSAT